LEYPHQPVLAGETATSLVHRPQGIYVDGTVGSGGHSAALARRLSPQGRLLCLDRDPQALQLAGDRLSGLGDRVTLVRANFADLGFLLLDLGVYQVDGVLLDLGMSTMQLEISGRGFSFQRHEPLDMRMDPRDVLTAEQIVNQYPVAEIEFILKEYGEESRARAIAKAIELTRRQKCIQTSSQLVEIVEKAIRPSRVARGRHPATRTFQALRIAVNQELNHLDRFLQEIPALISPGGRLAVISYHSLEDRRVKQAMTAWEGACTCPPGLPRCVCGREVIFRRIHRKGLRPSAEEIARNPRARSARLRIAERVGR